MTYKTLSPRRLLAQAPPLESPERSDLVSFLGEQVFLSVYNFCLHMTFEQYQTRKYMPELDGLRAISVLIVISVHMHSTMWRWMAGGLGVTIFFVLSGYLITMLLLREENQGGSVSLSAFYIRRAFRILPIYYVMLGVYALLICGMGIGAGKKPVFLKALPYYLTYLQDVPYFFHTAGAQALPFYHSWSLGIEEKFYLIWPLLGFVALGASMRRSRIALGFALAVILFAASLIQHPVANALYPYISILFGCILALVLHHQKSFEAIEQFSNGKVVAIVGAVLVIIHLGIPNIESLVIERIVITIYSFVVAMLIGGLVTGSSIVKQLLSWKALVFIGRISYGIYLCHILCLNAIETAIHSDGNPQMDVFAYLMACCLSIGIAYLTALLIEKPFIRVGHRLSSKILQERWDPKALPFAASSTR